MRRQQRKRIPHNETTLGKLNCLYNNQVWVKLLLGKDKKYDEFLEKMCQNDFFKNEERVSIKKISTDSGFNYEHVIKWIAQIYNDIYELNSEEFHLFKSAGIKHKCYFRYIDNHAYFTVWLPQSPKEFEEFDFHFVSAKVGTHRFWVKNITHYMENGEYSVHLELIGDNLNKYREHLVDKALFENVLNILTMYGQTKREIDEVLKRHYR